MRWTILLFFGSKLDLASPYVAQETNEVRAVLVGQASSLQWVKSVNCEEILPTDTRNS